MCARSHTLTDAIRSAIAEQARPEDPAPPAEPARRRIALWEQTDSVHCSLLGTCASVGDLRRVARRVGLEVADGTPDYDVHGHFVRMSTTDTPFSRAFQKLLDQRFEGALRKVARRRCDSALADLWTEMCDRGQVAGAYWAFMTSTHVPAALRVRIFGEVHMWSHLAGASFRQKTVENATLHDRLQAHEERARRIESGLRDALAERDRDIARLRAQIVALRGQRPSRDTTEETGASARDAAALRRRLAKAQRAVASARARARMAEGRLAELERRPVRENHAATPSAPAPSAPTPDGENAPEPALQVPRTVLYVGGLNAQRARLGRIAARFNATVLHHDGGVEDAPQRLDRLLPSVDCVFCPVSCVSHDACLRAKRGCHKLNKPFVPLRSAGQGAFQRALRDLVAAREKDQIPHDSHADDARTGDTPSHDGHTQGETHPCTSP
ncbi:DUF2325 domain-containing protein [Stappia sp.]|uniref:DUF2325 domain-containing protein n=1 Tax=Stappia sp. TaxID=1870903 RepID=UPI0032D9A7DB